MNGTYAATSGMVFLATAWGFFVMVFWMVCGWRAMLAHERIAYKLERLTDLPRDKQ